jgi:hypothetical protein
MTDPKKAPDAQDAPKPQKTGFGTHADKYRDRWDSGHPGAKKRPTDAGTPATPPTPDGGTSTPTP